MVGAERVLEDFDGPFVEFFGFIFAICCLLLPLLKHFRSEAFQSVDDFIFTVSHLPKKAGIVFDCRFQMRMRMTRPAGEP
jgi:hypothetical protein